MTAIPVERVVDRLSNSDPTLTPRQVYSLAATMLDLSVAEVRERYLRAKGIVEP